jgi:two-component system, NarL family, nitrate/nitrite response regulator NarL
VTGEPPIRVLIADDHPIYRDGLAAALAADERLALVDACADGVAALEAIRREAPAVAVLDRQMPGLDGQEVLEALDAERLDTRVLLLTAFTEGERALAAIEAGAAGYLSKETPREAVCDAVVRIAQGNVVIEPAVQAAVATALRDRRHRPTGLLTPRELEILSLLAAGFSAPQIADHLVIGRTTVKTHLANLYEKLGVGDRAAAVAEGMRRGLLR